MRCTGPLVVRDDEEPDTTRTFFEFEYAVGCNWCGLDHKKEDCPHKPIVDPFEGNKKRDNVRTGREAAQRRR